MKTNLLLIGAALFLGIVSCQKQPLDTSTQQTNASTVTLSQDENLRLMLMNEGMRSDQELLNSVTSLLPKFATKSLTFAITDSLTFDSNTKSTDPITVYVVSNGDLTGFALTVKEFVLPTIVGYFDGEFDKDNMNPGFAIMLENTLAQFTYIRDSINRLKNDDIYCRTQAKLGLLSPNTRIIDDNEKPPVIPPWDRNETTIYREWREEIEHISPMLKTRWGQGSPFNDWDPDKNPAGCTAISAAQIMAYFKHPAVSPVNGQPYDWNAMINNLWSVNGSSNASRLSRDLGSTGYLNIEYKPGGSSAKCQNTPRTLEKMGYIGGSHSAYNYSNLMNGLSIGPVHICADDGGKWVWQGATSGLYFTGHAWVVDGLIEYRSMQQQCIKFYYQGNLVYTMYSDPCILYGGYMFHNNFGWSGKSDGWYFIGKDYMPHESCKQNIELITGIRPRI